jgi:hypothetical protein
LGVEFEEIGLDQIVDEQPAFEIGGVENDLAAFDIELADELVVIEAAKHRAAEHPEDQCGAFRPYPLLAEIDAALEIGHVEIAVEIGFVDSRAARKASPSLG